jgi:hypothetical protein
MPVNLLCLIAARATKSAISPITTRTPTSKINQFVGFAISDLPGCFGIDGLVHFDGKISAIVIVNYHDARPNQMSRPLT